ncbi:hypothetical protein [Chitinophaga ginsengisoli]|uniref:Uncharacterized protein n=1 Tax=Chitinophaga ginsengisoli TaxID=363837 RepID=A0A2P8FMM8_9BACT|nr:hypothetical protein [Chitinophaga ginsengisoli]PSL22984.1 hypothetical protein CLV42_1194 [Chitinophaga ginsengisoli]
MNSKQVNFFLAPEDQAEVINFFTEVGCEVVQENTRKSGQPVYFDIKKDLKDAFHLYLCTPEFLETLAFRCLECRQEYYIDILKSNAIEFSIGGFYPYSNKEIHRSRLYFVSRYCEGDSLFQRDEEFLFWADNIFKAFKKAFLVKDKSILRDIYGTRNLINWVNRTRATMTVDGSKFIVP